MKAAVAICLVLFVVCTATAIPFGDFMKGNPFSDAMNKGMEMMAKAFDPNTWQEQAQGFVEKMQGASEEAKSQMEGYMSQMQSMASNGAPQEEMLKKFNEMKQLAESQG